MERLPDLHRDPFDRMLVAQALEEPCRLVTHDARVVEYSASILVVQAWRHRTSRSAARASG